MNKEKLKVQNNPEKKHQQTETQEYQSLTIDSTLATTETRIQVRGESSELENEIREKTETEKLLSGTKTEEKLLNIVNYPEFSSLGNTPQERLDKIFKKVNLTITSYIERQFNFSKEQMAACPILKNSLIPAIEWYLLDVLKGEKNAEGQTGGNEANNGALDIFNKTNTDLLGIIQGIFSFATTSQYLYKKIKTLQRAIDFLAIHKDILSHGDQYEELANPYKCMKFLSGEIWSQKATDNLFDEKIKPATVGLHLKDKKIPVGMTREEKEELVDKLGNIQVVNNTKTTKNIINALGKAEQFIKATGELKQQATISLKNINEPLQIFESLGFNITNRISESSFLKGIADFFCSAIGFPGGFEGFKRERDLMNGTYHTDESPDSEDEDKTENNGEEDKDDKNTLSETKILEQAKKNLENLITFQEQFLKDYESEISPKEKKEFERLIEDTKELQNNDDFSLAKYQKEVENLTKKTKDQTKKYLTTNDDKAPLQAIFDENKAIRKKMEEFRKQEKKGKDEKTDSQSSDIGTPDTSDNDSSDDSHNEDLDDHYHRENFLSGNGLEPYHKGGKILFDNLISKNMPNETENFKKKLLEIASYLEINPNRMMLLFMHESGVNPHIAKRNGYTARGLFQLLNQYSKHYLGYSSDEFAKKSGTEQLEAFKIIYAQYKGKIKSYEDISLMCFAPTYFNQKDNPDFVIYNTPDKVQGNAPYDINKDGKITMKEFKQKHREFIKKNVPQEMQNQFISN